MLWRKLVYMPLLLISDYRIQIQFIYQSENYSRMHKTLLKKLDSLDYIGLFVADSACRSWWLCRSFPREICPSLPGKFANKKVTDFTNWEWIWTYLYSTVQEHWQSARIKHKLAVLVFKSLRGQSAKPCRMWRRNVRSSPTTLGAVIIVLPTTTSNRPVPRTSTRLFDRTECFCVAGHESGQPTQHVTTSRHGLRNDY